MPGFTVAVQVGNTVEAVAFYARILGRKPDFAAHNDFHEWELCAGAWLQVSSGHEVVAPSSRIRFQVDDIADSVSRLRADGLVVEDPTTLPRVVAFNNFADPWGNKLGFYEDLAGPDGPPEVGGSASDPSHFAAGVVKTD